MRNIAIIGGGASGMAAAIAAAEERKDTKVLILEHKDTTGKKILSTGNGRCNLTNEYMEVSCFRSDHPDQIAPVLEQFGTEETLKFFERLGVLTKSRNGYIYPRSDQASTISEILQMHLHTLGVQIYTNTYVKEIARTKKGFRIVTTAGNYTADKVILATGGKAASVLGSDGSGYGMAKSFGHRLSPVVPSLVQLKVKKHPFQKAS
ncbi:MAG: aminoacetone oxidase family FAD-binding enzyme, partial [Dorea sp.]